MCNMPAKFINIVNLLSSVEHTDDTLTGRCVLCQEMVGYSIGVKQHHPHCPWRLARELKGI